MPDAIVLAVVAIGVAMLAYTVTGGADFGGGVWDLLASGPRKEDQRRAIAKVMAPIWEVNHVWLIAVVVLLFVCFPRGFGIVATALHLPLTMMLVGVVLRGTAFTFRAYGLEPPEAQGRWGFVFSISSVVTPLFLGACAGALVAGDIRVTDGIPTSGFVGPWLQLFPALVGLFFLAQCAQLAAVYLCVETAGDLRGDFRTRAIGSGVVVGVLAWAALFAAPDSSPVATLATVTSTTLALHTGIGAAAIGTLGSLLRGRFALARVLVVLQTAGILLGWAIATGPLLVVPDVSFASVAAPTAVIEAVIITFAIGGALLLPALVLLYRTFSRRGGARLT
jgi:cytochrome d ubiquinol oxidase subunit II